VEYPDLPERIRPRGVLPLREMGFWAGSAANLRLARRSIHPNGAARQRLAGLSRHHALCHLMPCVHEVKIDDCSDAASYELTEVSDIVGIIGDVCISLTINLSVCWRSSA
jgi:hypothetical protein